MQKKVKQKTIAQSLVTIDKRGRTQRHVIDARGQLLCRKKYKSSVRERVREPVDCGACLNRLEWRAWDWTQNDASLAREKGISKERIRIIRGIVKAPRSPNFRHRGIALVNKAAGLPNHIWTTESNPQIAKRLGCYWTYVTAIRQKLGKPAGKRGGRRRSSRKSAA